jgi:hypothetical protein
VDWFPIQHLRTGSGLKPGGFPLFTMPVCMPFGYTTPGLFIVVV